MIDEVAIVHSRCKTIEQEWTKQELQDHFRIKYLLSCLFNAESFGPRDLNKATTIIIIIIIEIKTR